MGEMAREEEQFATMAYNIESTCVSSSSDVLIVSSCDVSSSSSFDVVYGKSPISLGDGGFVYIEGPIKI